MEDDDDFTFPTVGVAAARDPAPAPDGQLGGPPVPRLLHQLPLPDLAAAASSPLWPFAGSPKATVTADGYGRRADEAGGDKEERRAAADEERMDLLWEGATTTATAPAPQSTGRGAGRAEPHPPKPTVPTPEPSRAEADGDDKRRAAAVADAERMDKLWESFNEEPLLLRRGRTKPADRPGGNHKDWYLCSYPPSDDAEDSEGTSASSPAERRGYGCAPTMLRASSRAGGAGQFCGGSPRGGRRRGAAAGWALLLRLFRRLLAVDKATAASRAHASIYVP
ncbi:skin secretory protein xP2-like [Panicum miliaceum]|uniref:Skin secretory protein xP2-like n=1 Tax=Panicum miliaceum TaxID=4540 RepID=A0A3L6RWK8_PANMI|nr:skin secretory protein xP2-like [Panicum miliaceum]